MVDLYISPDENNVHIKVIDTGIGLSSGDVSRIFDRFYQAENGKQLSEANPGTGLGLALSKNIVNLHHGEITVQSQLGYGTIFTITLLKGKAHFENDDRSLGSQFTIRKINILQKRNQILFTDAQRNIILLKFPKFQQFGNHIPHASSILTNLNNPII